MFNSVWRHGLQSTQHLCHGILPGKSTGVGFPSGKVLTFCDSLSPYVKWCVCGVCVCVVCGVWCVWCVCVCVVCVCLCVCVCGVCVCVCVCVSQAYYPASGLFRVDTQVSPFYPPHQIWRQDTRTWWRGPFISEPPWPLLFCYLSFQFSFFFFDLHSICTQRASLSHNAYTFCSTVQPTFTMSNKTSFEISLDNIFLLPPKLLKKHEFITGFESLNPLEMNVLN